jgi:hypothetical protein
MTDPKFEQTKFESDQAESEVFDELQLRRQLKELDEFEIISRLFHRAEFLPQAVECLIEELRSRGYDQTRLDALFEEIRLDESIKEANSTLALTEKEKLKYLLTPAFFSARMIADFEKDGCAKKLEEIDSLRFAQRYTSSFWILVPMILVGLILYVYTCFESFLRYNAP